MGMRPTASGPRRARRALRAALGAFAILAALGQAPVHAQSVAPEDDAAGRAARWKQLQEALFPGRKVEDAGAAMRLEAPLRAQDAALVPIEVQLPDGQEVRGVYVIIDENPAPLAAHFTFGPESDPRSVKMRVRVNAYTDMHAVAETADGRLLATARYVKAAGGCSAPAGSDEEQALLDIGLMKLRLLDGFDPGKPMHAQLMVRHPNFNGMQMDPVKRTFTPPRYIRTIDASYEGRVVFHLDADISLSTDPVITFGFIPGAKGRMSVVVQDSEHATFTQDFPVPAG